MFKDNLSFIISAELAEASKTANAISTQDLLYVLLNAFEHDVRIIPCTGVYKGVEEQGFVVQPVSLDDKMALGSAMYDIADMFHQESILVIKPTLTAGLFYLKSGDPEMGIWQEVHLLDDTDMGFDYTSVAGKYYVLI